MFSFLLKVLATQWSVHGVPILKIIARGCFSAIDRPARYAFANHPLLSSGYNKKLIRTKFKSLNDNQAVGSLRRQMTNRLKAWARNTL
jgi:hypothetical protein